MHYTIQILPKPTSEIMQLTPQKIEEKKYQGSYVYGAQSASIAKRNARERNRVKQVNDSFNALRQRIPSAVISALSRGPRRGTGKKLSKVDTLRMVVEYIRYLEELVKDKDAVLDMANIQEEFKEDYWTQGGEDEDISEGSSQYSDPISSPSSNNSTELTAPDFGYFNSSYHTITDGNLNATDDQFLEAMWYNNK